MKKKKKKNDDLDLAIESHRHIQKLFLLIYKILLKGFFIRIRLGICGYSASIH